MNTLAVTFGRLRQDPKPKAKPSHLFACTWDDAENLGAPWQACTACYEANMPKLCSGPVAFADIEGTPHNNLGPNAAAHLRHAAIQHFRSRHDGMRVHVGDIPLIVYAVPNVGATSLDGTLDQRDAVHSHWRWVMDEISHRPGGPKSIVYPCAVLYDRYGQAIPQDGEPLVDADIERKTMRTRALCASENAARRGTPWAVVVTHRQPAIARRGVGGRCLVPKEIDIIADVIREMRPPIVYYWQADKDYTTYLHHKQAWMEEDQRQAIIAEWEGAGEWGSTPDKTRAIAAENRRLFAARIVEALA